jgi:sugar phosphate isomerase/epimerase
MKLMVRAHDLGVKGADNINNKICELGLDGVQLVAYKSIDGISYSPCSLSSEQAKEIGSVIRKNGKEIALIGAYFNPVHPNTDKISNGIAVFKDYLTLAKCLGCDFVGSETGSYNGDPWIYHPMNHSDEALDRVVETFSLLADCAEENAVNIAIIHNHPSGDPTPSHEDIMITAKIKEAAALLDISFIDHIIIGNRKYTSLKDKALM